jgi:protein required for attachment to host cells
MTPHPSEQWIVTADSRQAALFSCRRTPGGELHIDRERLLEAVEPGQREHHRPDHLSGGERRASVSHSSAHAAAQGVSIGHEVEEDQKRFARQVRDWLGRARRDLGADRIVVFAAPRFLGLLREQIGPPVDLREGSLTSMSTAQLAEHPAVRGALQPTT